MSPDKECDVCGVTSRNTLCGRCEGGGTAPPVALRRCCETFAWQPSCYTVVNGHHPNCHERESGVRGPFEDDLWEKIREAQGAETVGDSRPAADSAPCALKIGEWVEAGAGQTFATIWADPDWKYDNFGAKKHGAARAHYPGSTEEVVGSIPITKWGRKNTTYFVWMTLPKLQTGFRVLEKWGLEQVTAIPWVKTVPSSAELAQGIGFWSFVPAELLVVARPARGNGNAPAYGNGKPDKPIGLLVDAEDGDGSKMQRVFYARRGPHSRKPLSLIEWVEAFFPGPFLELYATGERPGWTCWGKNTGVELGSWGARKVPAVVDYEGGGDAD